MTKWVLPGGISYDGDAQLTAMSEFKWHRRFLDLAKHISSWSKDPTTQVGCVIVDDKKVIIGTGYNGFPRGVLDSEEMLKDRNRKRMRTIHAEMNALHFATKSIAGGTVYVTHYPCATCAANLIQHEPFMIVIAKQQDYPLGPDWQESIDEALTMFKERGIRVEIY